jgi:protein TonB
MTPEAMTQAERPRATVAQGGFVRLLGFLAASVLVHGLLVLGWVQEPSPRRVAAPLLPVKEQAVVWFESPALPPSRLAAPVAEAPAPVPAPVAPVAVRRQVPTVKREPVAVPEKAVAAPEVKPPPVEPVPSSASPERVPVAQETGALAAGQQGTVSPEGIAGSAAASGSAAAPGSSGAAGSAGSAELMAYARRLYQVVASQKRYPASAARLGMEGRAHIRVSVQRDGALAGAPRLARSSGHEVLDAEALRMVEAAAPFAPLPEGFSRPAAEFVISVDFSLRTAG